ncbi:MAG: ABC transporter permease subunit, partial [Chitinophagaceae bacterium]
EWLKIKKYPAFWWMLGMVALTYPGINYLFYKVFLEFTQRKDMTGAMAKTLLGNPFSFPETWHSVAYFSSLFIVIPAVLVIMLITNEYQFKTHRQNIIDGWSKQQFVWSKMLDVAIVTFVIVGMYLITAAAFGSWVKPEVANNSTWKDEIKYIPLFMLQTFSQLSFAFFIGMLVRKAFIALGIFIFYYAIVENIALGIFKWYKLQSLSKFLPLEISDKLIPNPQFLGKFDAKGYELQLAGIQSHILYTIVFTAIIWLTCFFMFRKRDL